jgi:hypothetical protein
MKNIHKINNNIYITSDEEIKDGDWCINIGRLNETIIFPDKIIGKADYTADVLIGSNWRKIILTTDQDLIKDGVQAIDDEFLEWFVKNPSCEEVEYVGDDCYYEIIIPQEEHKQETLELKRNYQKHYLTKTKGYKLWCNIIQRCYNPKNHSYKYYGEKGVVMEDYFKNSYENFIDWIKGIANYDNWLNSSELSLDRIDNTLGYIRGNIKFSTKTEQVENQNLRIDNKSDAGYCIGKANNKKD